MTKRQERDAEKLSLFVAERIKQLREEQNLTQQALSERVELSRSSIANIEAARQTLTLKTIASLAHALRVSVVELIGG